MEVLVERALNAAIDDWNFMTDAESDDAESAANEFESSFYRFIDAVRVWVDGLEQRPQNMKQLLDMRMTREILDRLPEPLHLNFETEAELILDHQIRIDEDKVE